MFDNILTDYDLNFNELEKNIYKFVCNLGCYLLKEIIENYDHKLQNERDKNILRHRGLKSDTIKTVMGVVEYKRAIYEYKENDNKKFISLLDENLQLAEYGKILKKLVDKILNMAVKKFI